MRNRGNLIVNHEAFNKSMRLVWLFLMLMYIATVWVIPDKVHPRLSEMEKITYNQFIENLNEKEYEKVYHTTGYNTVYAYHGDEEGTYDILTGAEYDGFKLVLLEAEVVIEDAESFVYAEQKEEYRTTLVAFMGTCLLFAAFIHLIRAIRYPSKPHKVDTVFVNMVPPMNMANMFNPAQSVQTDINSVESSKTFEDIAGLKEVKRDVKCIVDFLVNKDKYIEAGAKLPKGVILYGPPGTGKTLLAKAIAGEAQVPFLYMSGSEFVEMFVGVGAKRVRELFAKARKSAPCIIFIDEIDSIGSKRVGGENGEDRKTINALLTEMDGFNESDNIIVIGATNRIEDLDPALMRPGRFTNKYCVPLPETVDERLEVIKLYTANKKFDETVEFKALAKETVGFSPAKIEALLNEAAIISVQENSPFITKSIIDKAMCKILLSGHMREDNSKRRKDELELVAWHEAGHAVVGHILGKEVSKVTIVSSTSGAGGFTLSTPEEKSLHSIEDIENIVMELYGGRAAEYLLHDGDKTKVTTGASNDIERATALIQDSIIRYGMSDKFGLINLSKAKVNNQDIIEEQVRMSKHLEEKTITLLKENRDKLETIANLLLEKETLYAKDIDELFAA